MVVAGDAGFPEFPELFPAEDAVGGAKVGWSDSFFMAR